MHCNEDKVNLKLGKLGLGALYKLHDGCNVALGACKGPNCFKWAVGAECKNSNCKIALDSDINLSASKSRKFGDNITVTKWISFSVDAAIHNVGGYEDWCKGGMKVCVDS